MLRFHPSFILGIPPDIRRQSLAEFSQGLAGRQPVQAKNRVDLSSRVGGQINLVHRDALIAQTPPQIVIDEKHRRPVNPQRKVALHDLIGEIGLRGVAGPKENVADPLQVFGHFLVLIQ